MKFVVELSGAAVGVLAVADPVATFTFADEYIESSNRQVLGLAFEEDLLRGWSGINRMPAWFSNLLPEGQLRAYVGSELRLPPNNATSVRTEATILQALGEDLPGAVSVRPMGETDLVGRDRFPVRLEAPRSGEARSAEGLRFSVAGVGIKFSMMRSGNQFSAPASGLDGRWLVKLPDKSFPHLPVNEFAVMTWARACGLDVPEIMLVHRDEVSDVPDYMWAGEHFAYAIRRFDRPDSGARVHIEDLAQVRGLYSESKYQGNFETVASLVYRGHDSTALEEFLRRLAFSIAVGNDDAHLKNWSLIYPDGRKPTLSPAYDLVSAAAYPDAGLARDLGLKLAGSRRYDHVSIGSFKSLVARVGGDVDAASIIQETLARMTTGWDLFEETFGAAPDMLAPIKAHFSEMSRRLG